MSEGVERLNYYQEDLAYIHDSGFGDFARNAGAEVINLLHKQGIHGGLITDLACGTGIFSEALLAAGYEVFGVDVSADMLNIAKRRAPAAALVQASLLSAELPPSRAVTILGEGINYLFDEANDLSAVTRLFTRIYDALEPGGLLAFDTYQRVIAPKGAPQTLLREGEDWAVFVRGEVEAGVLTRRIVNFRKVGAGYRRSEETHRQRLYKGAELAEILRKIGFKARVHRGYGGFALAKSRAVVLAKKPPS